MPVPRPAKHGRATCQDCLDRSYATKSARLARGLCKCGGERKPGCVSCVVCLVKAATRSERITQDKIERGVCIEGACWKPAMPDRRKCAVHLKQSAERAKRYR
jgi:hypothetical protein